MANLMANFMSDMLDGMAKVAALTPVYPSYLASVIKKSLLGGDTEATFRAIGPIETVGDCRYAMTVTDLNGSEYRVTVEVLRGKSVLA